LWAKSPSDISIINPPKLALDNKGNIYYSGSYIPSESDSPYYSNKTKQTDFFVEKLNSKGKSKGIVYSYGNGKYTLDELKTDMKNNVYFTGSFQNSSLELGDKTLENKYNANGFVVKTNPKGQIIWTKVFGGEITVSAVNLSVTSNSDCFLTSFYDSKWVGIDSTLIPNPKDYTEMVMKLDSKGETIWLKQFGYVNKLTKGYTNSQNHIVSQNINCQLVTDRNGDCYIQGNFKLNTSDEYYLFDSNFGYGKRIDRTIKVNDIGINELSLRTDIKDFECEELLKDYNGELFIKGKIKTYVTEPDFPEVHVVQKEVDGVMGYHYEFRPPSQSEQIGKMKKKNTLYLVPIDSTKQYIALEYPDEVQSQTLAQYIKLDTDRDNKLYMMGRFYLPEKNEEGYNSQVKPYNALFITKSKTKLSF